MKINLRIQGKLFSRKWNFSMKNSQAAITHTYKGNYNIAMQLRYRPYKKMTNYGQFT